PRLDHTELTRTVSKNVVGQDPVRARPWPSGAGAGDADGLEHGAELRAVAGLPGRQHYRQRFAALLAGKMDLRGQPAAGAPQPVICRLRTGRFTLVIRLVAGAGG